MSKYLNMVPNHKFKLEIKIGGKLKFQRDLNHHPKP